MGFYVSSRSAVSGDPHSSASCTAFHLGTPSIESILFWRPHTVSFVSGREKQQMQKDIC